jgi:hypothetical protein
MPNPSSTSRPAGHSGRSGAPAIHHATLPFTWRRQAGVLAAAVTRRPGAFSEPLMPHVGLGTITRCLPRHRDEAFGRRPNSVSPSPTAQPAKAIFFWWTKTIPWRENSSARRHGFHPPRPPTSPIPGRMPGRSDHTAKAPGTRRGANPRAILPHPLTPLAGLGNIAGVDANGPVPEGKFGVSHVLSIEQRIPRSARAEWRHRPRGPNSTQQDRSGLAPWEKALCLLFPFSIAWASSP